MRVILAAGLVALAACASPGPRVEGQPYAGRLDISAAGEDVADIEARFSQALTARYGERPGAEAVKRDLQKQGFLCRDVPPVEARTDYLVAACELPKPRGLCSDLFVVSLRFVGNSRALDHTRVRPDGSFERTCVKPAAS